MADKTKIDHGEVEREEINGANRLVLVTYFDSQNNALKSERIQIPVDATRERIQRTISRQIEKHNLGIEIENRINDIKAVSGDPVGMKANPQFDEKKWVDDLVQYRKLSNEASLNSGERKRRLKLYQKSNLTSEEQTELDNLNSQATLTHTENETLVDMQGKFDSSGKRGASGNRG